MTDRDRRVHELPEAAVLALGAEGSNRNARCGRTF